MTRSTADLMASAGMQDARDASSDLKVCNPTSRTDKQTSEVVQNVLACKKDSDYGDKWGR